MKGSENFPILFKRIGNYLDKAPNATPKELKAAKDAFKTLHRITYGGLANCYCDGIITKHKNF
jgi:hypothetical protein